MKAVIMTTALSLNYGAALQTYASARAVEKLGVSAEVYRYIDAGRLIYGMSAVSLAKNRLWNRIRKWIGKGVKEKRFDEFRERYIPLTEKNYHNNRELREDPGDYDVYIAGSDQIWNPSLFQYDLSYFLDFVPEGKRKISFATSFGKTVFGSEKYREPCGRLLADLQAISVREKSGVKIVEELSGKPAEWVLDPTLLLTREEWAETFGGQDEKGDYILCYVMPGDRAVTDAIEAIAKRLSKEKGLPIVRLGMKEFNVFRYGKAGCDIGAGPAEFIRYFLNARYVVTNSFHGTAMSLIFERPLFVPINANLPSGQALHERMLSLLELLKAERVLVPTDRIQDPELFTEHVVDYEIIRKRLEEEREKSMAFLSRALRG